MVGGTVRTAPRGRARLRFTSFGDQSTPTLDAVIARAFGNDNVGSPSAGDITTAVSSRVSTINAGGAMLVLVAYDIP